MFDSLWRNMTGRRRTAKKCRQTPACQARPRLEILEDRCLLSAAVAIVVSPMSQTVAVGKAATFQAAATGSPTPTVQWEMSVDGGKSFAPVAANANYSGVNTGTLTVTGVTAALSGDEFEAVFSNGVAPNPNATTSAATLTVATTDTPLTINRLSVSNWTQGLTKFTGVMTINGGTGPFAIVSDANLPPGVTAVINGDTIGFTGTPTVAKNFNAGSVTIEDAFGNTATEKFAINVTPAVILGNPTQTQWTVGQTGFSSTMTIGGGTGAFSLVSSSGLPTGVTAVVSGKTIRLTGVPTAVGAFANGSVTVADADGATATQTFAITINAAPTLSQLNELQWTANTSGYDGLVNIIGGTGPYTISTYANLPFTPVISGNTIYFTGNAPENTYYDATFTVRDKTGATVTQSNTMTINPAVTFDALTANQWTVGQPGFNGTITINYGTQPFTITGFTALPNGLTPVVNGGTISFAGTPTVAGAFGSGSIAFEDTVGEIFNVGVGITIKPALTFTTTALPIVTSGNNYGTALKATGGTGGITFALTGGSLPAGLTLQSNGHLGGTTNATGDFTFTATATDAAGAHAIDTFNIAIGPAISLGNPTQAQWTVGQAGYTGKIAVNGGAGSFSLTSATGLPTGLKAVLNGRTVTFTGSPTVVGTFGSGSITVSDSEGISATELVSITINAAPTVGTFAAVPWTAGIDGYPVAIPINGGTGPYTVVSAHGMPFSPVVSGNTILLTGSGSAGTYSKGVITLRDKAGATVTVNISPIIINPGMTISHMSVNNWTQGEPGFPGTLTISGGTGPFSIVIAKNIPLGLNPIITGNTISFTGTPEVAATVGNCSITIRDASGAMVTKVFVFDIAPPLMIATNHLPVWRSGVNYSTNLNATGGTGTKTFTLTGGSLPTGLTLSHNGKISGKATSLTPFTFTVTVTDSAGASSTETFTL